MKEAGQIDTTKQGRIVPSEVEAEIMFETCTLAKWVTATAMNASELLLYTHIAAPLLILLDAVEPSVF